MPITPPAPTNAEVVAWIAGGIARTIRGWARRRAWPLSLACHGAFVSLVLLATSPTTELLASEQHRLWVLADALNDSALGPSTGRLAGSVGGREERGLATTRDRMRYAHGRWRRTTVRSHSSRIRARCRTVSRSSGALTAFSSGVLGTIGHGTPHAPPPSRSVASARADAHCDCDRVGATRGPLPRASIRRVIRRHRDEVELCYAQGLVEHRELEGEMTVLFIVSQTGRVQASSVSSSTLGSPSVEQCVASTVRRWTFPATDEGATLVTQPIALRTHEGHARSTQRARARRSRTEASTDALAR